MNEAFRLAWRKTSFCASGECIEVAQRDDLIILRDSTQPDGRMLRYPAEQWRSFICTVKASEFDSPSSWSGCLER
jgi:Domain of unknown function (DUF397)